MPALEYNSGDRIGGYVVLNQLGRGAMSCVYKAFDELLNRDVAIKVLNANLSNDIDAIQRFEREIEIVSRIHHRNVAQIFTFGRTEDNIPFIVCEYIDGPTFAEIIRKKMEFTIADYLDFMIQVATGLSMALQEQVIHRDIKPQNLLLDTGNIVKIVDFGMARIIWDEAYKSPEGTIVGTPHYMSPEMAAGRPIDHRGDIYSLAASFYHIIGGRTMFDGDTPLSIMLKHTTSQPLPLTSLNSQVTQSLWDIIEHMLEKDPNDRYQTYDELISDLKSELLAARNRFHESRNFVEYQDIIPRKESAGYAEKISDKVDQLSEISSRSSNGSVLSDFERRQRALSYTFKMPKKSSWGLTIFLIAILLIVLGTGGFLFGYFQKESLSDKKGRKGTSVGTVLRAINPISWFKSKKKEQPLSEFDRGVLTYNRIKDLYNASLLYETRESSQIDNLQVLVEMEYIQAETLKDGWGNDIIYVKAYQGFIAPGADGVADTDDDFVMGSNGQFSRIPHDFVLATFEKENPEPTP